LRFVRYFNFADESITSKSVTAPRPSTRDVYGTTSTWTFGIVRVGSAQFKVSRDDLIFVDKLSGRKLHEQVLLDDVLMISSRYHSKIGRPMLGDAKVYATVEEQYHDIKQTIFKKCPRKGHRRFADSRQERTALRISEIVGL